MALVAVGGVRALSGHLYPVKMTCVQAPRRLPPQWRRPAVAGWQNPIDAIRADYALDGLTTKREAMSTKDQADVSRQSVIEAISTVYDPEIPVNIYELGLIYAIDIDSECRVAIKMTLTAPACPVADILPLEVEEKVRGVEGITAVELDLVWDPPWEVEMMSEAARLELNF